MIELAPLPAPPAPPPPPAPEPPRLLPRPPEKVVTPSRPKPPPVVKKAEVALPPPPPPKALEAPPAEPVEKTPPTPEPSAARTATAPAPGTAAPPANAVPTWQGAVLAHLEHHKRYPSAAQFRRQQGVPMVRFIMGRDGRVLSAQLERSCGHGALDEEALALLERAQPLPAPPPEVAGNQIEMRVPVQFFLP
ncbi:MAG: TonB family protein [Magnetospirillum sp.]|nr:TonB family protein [Magnetospirillum sp.]